MTAPVPALDAKVTIPARLEKLGMSQRFFSELCEVSQTDLSRMLSGTKPMSGEQTKAFYGKLKSLEELKDMLEPLSFAWTSPATVNDWLTNPRFPALFALLSSTRLRQLTTEDMARLNAISAEGDRIQAETEAIRKKSQEDFLAWLNEYPNSGERSEPQESGR
jgi:hypothetical protein